MDKILLTDGHEYLVCFLINQQSWHGEYIRVGTERVQVQAENCSWSIIASPSNTTSNVAGIREDEVAGFVKWNETPAS